MFLFALAIKLPGRYFRRCYCDHPKGTLRDSPCPTTDEVFDGCIIVRRHLRSVSIWPCCKLAKTDQTPPSPLAGNFVDFSTYYQSKSNLKRSSELSFGAIFWTEFPNVEVHLIYSMLCKSPVCPLLNLEYNGSLSV